jgi:alkanesulfonate monooxygenase SsuD/methylene tetrahydromethanopterin reductase-like flavin-dependent oxidoreductase (luciferase family)
MITRPERASIPITLAALAPGGVRLAAEVADRWWPLFVTPDAIRGFWAEPLAEGGALRDASLGPLEVMASAIACVGIGAVADEARAAARREIAFYVGSMGSRERNYYASAVAGMGFAAEADAIQSAALGGDRRGVEALVSDAMLDELALIGDAPYVRKRLAALGDCGVTTLSLGPATPDPLGAVAGIRGALV